MRYAGVIYDDTAAAPGLSLTIFLQGCPLHCKGCHNPQTWDPDGGFELNLITIGKIMDGIEKNGVRRNLCIMGGEPMADYNLAATMAIIAAARARYPDLPVYIWSGYTYEELEDRAKQYPIIFAILKNCNYLIDGPYIEEQRDITLIMRGSKNQRVVCLEDGEPC